MKKISNFKKGFILLSLGLLCVSVIEIVGVLIYREGVGPVALLNIRAWIATLLFFLTLLTMKKGAFKIKKKDIIRLFFHSGILMVHLLLFWQALKVMNNIPTAIAIYLSFPFIIVIFSIIFLKEKFSKRRIISLTLGMIGALFIIKFLPNFTLAKTNLFGMGLMFSAAFFWASYLFVGKKLLTKYNPITILFYNFLLCLVGFGLIQSPAIAIGQLTPASIKYLLIIGIISTYLTYIFQYLGLSLMKASNMGIISLTKPLVSILLCFVILSQVLSFYQWIGAILIILGIYLLNKTND